MPADLPSVPYAACIADHMVALFLSSNLTQANLATACVHLDSLSRLSCKPGGSWDGVCGASHLLPLTDTSNRHLYRVRGGRGKSVWLRQVAEMGRKGHVLALNAVARGVADSQGWATIDMSPVIGCGCQSLPTCLHHTYVLGTAK